MRNFNDIVASMSAAGHKLRDAKRDRMYPAVVGDDDRVQYCYSCEKDVHTVPCEGVPNQSLRCCCVCGSYTQAR